MATGTKRLLEMSGEELGELIALVGGADTVELKTTIPESAQRSAVAALKIDPLEAQIRQVFFFDTPDLALSAERPRGSRSEDPGTVRRYGREAQAGRAGRAPG